MDDDQNSTTALLGLLRPPLAELTRTHTQQSGDLGQREPPRRGRAFARWGLLIGCGPTLGAGRTHSVPAQMLASAGTLRTLSVHLSDRAAELRAGSVSTEASGSMPPSSRQTAASLGLESGRTPACATPGPGVRPLEAEWPLLLGLAPLLVRGSAGEADAAPQLSPRPTGSARGPQAGSACRGLVRGTPLGPPGGRVSGSPRLKLPHGFPCQRRARGLRLPALGCGVRRPRAQPGQARAVFALQTARSVPTEARSPTEKKGRETRRPCLGTQSARRGEASCRGRPATGRQRREPGRRLGCSQSPPATCGGRAAPPGTVRRARAGQARRQAGRARAFGRLLGLVTEQAGRGRAWAPGRRAQCRPLG